MDEMKDKESVLIFGRLGKDPELLYTRKQEPVCYLAVAENGINEKSLWHKVVIFGRQAENCNLFAKKGVNVFVKGVKSLKHYVAKDGELKSFSEILASYVGITMTH